VAAAFARYLPHPAQKIWRALTQEEEHLAAWFPTAMAGELAVISAYQAAFGPAASVEGPPQEWQDMHAS